MSTQKVLERLRKSIEGVYNARTGALKVSSSNSSQFNEQVVVKRTSLIEANGSYGPSEFRDYITELNGGTVTKSATGEIALQTGVTASAEASIRSGEIGRYIPGYGAELGIGIRMPAPPTGTAYFKWGGVDATGLNGFHFAKDSTGLYVARLRNGIELDKTYQSNWNIDPLDGSGKSQHALVPSNGTIYQIDFTWYGYGQILFGIVDTIGMIQQFIPCHQINTFSETSVLSPNLSPFAGIYNKTTGTNYDLYVGGRQYSIVGDYIPKYRYTGDYFSAVTVGTTPTPIIAFRRKDGFKDRALKFQQYQIINTGNTKCLFELRVGRQIVGGTPSWGESLTNIANLETALEKESAPVSVVGGNNFWPPSWVEPGSRSNVGLAQQKVDISIPSDDEVVLVAYTLSGSTVLDGSLSFREEW